MVEKMVVERYQLMKELEKRIAKWKEDERVSFETFKNDFDKQNSICYNMLIAIQTAIDLGNLILERKLKTASTYAEIFEVLGEENIISNKLAKQLSSLARFRNVLAHLYWKIEYKRVYKVLKFGRKILESFLKAVKEYEWET
jgi:uncharacterized protein YutE (UPF0331/DUF86 family)